MQCAKEYALTHDLAEIRTGDCPTPFKSPLIKEALDELEEEIYPQLPITSKVRQLVKFCDTAEAVLFLRLYGLGKHAVDVQDLLAVQMWARLNETPFTPEQKQRLRDLFNDTFHQI